MATTNSTSSSHPACSASSFWRKAKWRAGCVLALAAVAFAPEIAVRCGFVSIALDAALAKHKLKIRSEGMELSWWRCIRLDGVVLSESGGDRVATIKQIASEKCLFSLIRDWPALGRFVINQPEVVVALGNEEPSLVRMLRELSTRSASETTDSTSNHEASGSKCCLPSWSLVIHNGRLEVQPPGVANATAIEPIHLSLEQPAASADKPSSFVGEASLGLPTADYFGFHLDRSELKARWRENWLLVEPYSVRLNSGYVRMKPEICLQSGEMRLCQGRIRFLENIDVTPEICANSLKFAIPFVADAVQAQGVISMDVRDVDIPLANASSITAEGRLYIHSLEVGANPLVRDIAGLVGVRGSARLLNNSTVDIHVANGRVHHDRLELRVGELAVCTRGSVGFDGSMDLVAELPVPGKLIGADLPLHHLAGHTLKLPIRGTLSDPRLDVSSLARENGREIRRAVEDAAVDEVGRQLDRLLGTKRK